MEKIKSFGLCLILGWMPEDHFKAQELQFLYFRKVHFSYYSVNKPQIKTETPRVILLSAIILQERQAGLDYLMSILQASRLPSVTFTFTPSEVLWWELEQLLVSTTHLEGFLPGIDRKKQECDGNTSPRHPLFLLISTGLGHSSTMNDKVRPAFRMFRLSHFISPILHQFTGFTEL